MTWLSAGKSTWCTISHIPRSKRPYFSLTCAQCFIQTILPKGRVKHHTWGRHDRTQWSPQVLVEFKPWVVFCYWSGLQIEHAFLGLCVCSCVTFVLFWVLPEGRMFLLDLNQTENLSKVTKMFSDSASQIECGRYKEVKHKCISTQTHCQIKGQSKETKLFTSVINLSVAPDWPQTLSVCACVISIIKLHALLLTQGD